MQADDLMAAAFPDAAACLENIPGDRQIPDRPLVTQTIHDCLHEAMDFEGLTRVLTSVHEGRLQLVTRDTPEPSPLAHEILNARPWAFLDDAPLEERRTQAVYQRRATEPSSANDIGRLDPAAIARVRDEARPDPRDADELHDALVTTGFLTDVEAAAIPDVLFAELASSRRASKAGSRWIAAERVPELRAIHPSLVFTPPIEPPSSRTSRAWTREEAIAELLRGRLSVGGPVAIARLARELDVTDEETLSALHVLEADGIVLRGHFESTELEFCDRGLLARIHRYTLNRLRAEIEPVSPADFMRFLFVWQHVDPAHRLSGVDGVRAIVGRLDGFEVPGRAWERSILPSRLDRYEPSMLDMVCLTGQAAWGRLSAPTRTLRVALCLREHTDAWRSLGPLSSDASSNDEGLDANARRVLQALR